MPELFGPIRRTRVAEELAAQIKQSIFNGTLKPGDKLPSERALAKQCSTSRVSVREAFRILEKEGLLLIKRGVEGGAFIIEVNNKTVEDSLGVFYRYGDVSFDHISETRLIIEPEIARLAAAKRTAEDLEKIEDVIERGQRFIDQGLYDVDAQLRFHYILAQTSRNPVLIAILNSVISYLEKNVPLLNPNPNIQKHIKDQQDHQKILDAIKNRDEEAAFRQMKEHILTFGLISAVNQEVRNGKNRCR